MGLDEAVGLAPRVRELNERWDTRGTVGPALHRRHVGHRVDHDVACPLEVVAVDHRVARQHQPRAAAGVGSIEANVALIGVVAWARYPLGHRGPAEPVLQQQATGQAQRLVQRGGHTGDDTARGCSRRPKAGGRDAWFLRVQRLRRRNERQS